jgi:DNA-binding Lrp family transcriptional regulator
VKSLQNGAHSLDSKDFEILAALYADARLSFLSLGRKVSLSSPSVRDRLERLKRQHILQGFMVAPDPNIFRREDIILYFDGEWTREDAIKAAAAANVYHVAWKIDGGLSVRLWPRNRLEAMRDLKSILGASPSWQVASDRKHREPLSLAELKIIDSLIDDSRAPFYDIVEKTALSPKTIRKHMKSLLGSQAINLRPKLGALTDSGDLIFQLLVFGNVEMDMLRRALGNVVLVTNMQKPPAKYLFCHGKDLADVALRQQQVTKLPGVKSVTITLNREIFVATDFLHSLVREEIVKLRDGN